jgi:hypothetical protein
VRRVALHTHPVLVDGWLRIVLAGGAASIVLALIRSAAPLEHCCEGAGEASG